MSFPAAAGAATAAIAATNPLDVLMAGVNSNPYFIGIMMLLLNLGGRFLALEISKDQEKFLSHPVIRRFFLFAVLFVATRNVIIAAGLTVIVIFVLGYLFNENSELCLWKSCITPASAADAKAGTEGFQGLSAEEAMILRRLQDKQTAAAAASTEAASNAESPEKQTPVAKAADIYNSSLTQISSASS
jgi:hypothetical protein